MVAEADPAFREALDGDDPGATLECETEVAGLLRDVRPALEAAARHLGIETPEFGSAEREDRQERPDVEADPYPEIPF